MNFYEFINSDSPHARVVASARSVVRLPIGIGLLALQKAGSETKKGVAQNS
jgi:hypothetical protein